MIWGQQAHPCAHLTIIHLPFTNQQCLIRLARLHLVAMLMILALLAIKEAEWKLHQSLGIFNNNLPNYLPMPGKPYHLRLSRNLGSHLCLLQLVLRKETLVL